MSIIQLKADFLPFTVLQISQPNIGKIKTQLQSKINQAPKYFNQAPVIIDIDKTPENDTLNLVELCELLKTFKIMPIGIRGINSQQQKIATSQGLPVLKKTSAQPAPAPTEKKIPGTNTRIITKPLRAGTQTYAPDGDLIILAAVNAGAECIADGSIHVYGPLRGKALAGAKGNTQARIFCKSLEAELISVAGHYLVKDNLKVPQTKKPILQVFLKDDKLNIEGI